MMFLAFLSLIIAALAIYAFSKDNGKNSPHNRRSAETSAEALRNHNLLQTKSSVN
jgi:hypothetical protein